MCHTFEKTYVISQLVCMYVYARIAMGVFVCECLYVGMHVYVVCVGLCMCWIQFSQSQ